LAAGRCRYIAEKCLQLGVCISRFVLDHFPFHIQSDHGKTVVDAIMKEKELFEPEDLVFLEPLESIHETVIELLKRTMEKTYA
jgi:hypothetical protein